MLSNTLAHLFDHQHTYLLIYNLHMIHQNYERMNEYNSNIILFSPIIFST